MAPFYLIFIIYFYVEKLVPHEMPAHVQVLVLPTAEGDGGSADDAQGGADRSLHSG